MELNLAVKVICGSMEVFVFVSSRARFRDRAVTTIQPLVAGAELRSRNGKTVDSFISTKYGFSEQMNISRSRLLID